MTNDLEEEVAIVPEVIPSEPTYTLDTFTNGSQQLFGCEPYIVVGAMNFKKIDGVATISQVKKAVEEFLQQTSKV